jgi:hypothetical protein
MIEGPRTGEERIGISPDRGEGDVGVPFPFGVSTQSPSLLMGPIHSTVSFLKIGASEKWVCEWTLTMKQTTALRAFVRNECANYDKHRKGCFVGDCCKVMKGQRCSYFERCVLGLPDCPHKLPGYDYAKLFAQYAEQTGADAQKVEQRRCGCGTPLLRRQRCCDSCAHKRRIDAYRRRRQKQAG